MDSFPAQSPFEKISRWGRGGGGRVETNPGGLAVGLGYPRAFAFFFFLGRGQRAAPPGPRPQKKGSRRGSQKGDLLKFQREAAPRRGLLTIRRSLWDSPSGRGSG